MSDQNPRQALEGSVLKHRDEWEKSFVSYGLPKQEIAHRIGLLALILDKPKEKLSQSDQQAAGQLMTTRIDEDDYLLIRDSPSVRAAEEAIRQSRTEENIQLQALTEWRVLYEGFVILLQDPSVSD